MSPHSVVGIDYESGELITAGCRGRVVAVTFSGGEHALIVVVEAPPEIETPAE